MGAKTYDYHKLVNYDIADPAKVLAQKEGLATAKNMPFGFSEVAGTRGESAYVFDMGDMYGAIVQEGLGTKSLIAQKIYTGTGTSHFAAVAQDTVGTIINDLISVGATPVVLNAYWSSSSFDWLGDEKLTTDFIKGWRAACDKSGVSWGGGETQSLPGMVEEGALEFAGCGFGVVKPKSRLVQDKNLAEGDIILLIESNGVHANGISLAREIAEGINEGYQAKLSDGSLYGETLLRPSHLYAELTRNLQNQDVKIHYLSNITGHGWRKLMRANRDFTYVMDEVPPVLPIFKFIREKSKNSLKQMYSNYNMGAGYALYLPETEVDKARKVAQDLGFTTWKAGRVEKGPRRVIIKPLNITYSSESLEVR